MPQFSMRKQTLYINVLHS